MKRIIAFVLVLLFLASTAYAGWVNGYTRRDGTVVQGYNRSDSNSTVTDNYSFKGNTNPYTGEEGHNYNRNSPSSPYYGTSNTNSDDNAARVRY